MVDWNTVLTTFAGEWIKQIIVYIVAAVIILLALLCFCVVGCGGAYCVIHSYRSSHNDNKKNYTRAKAPYDGAAAFDDANIQRADEKTAARKQTATNALKLAFL